MRREKLEAIARKPLHTEVADRLRHMILQGTLAPGERLNERLLTERFSVSRTPLREAIKMLSSEGLVDLLPNRGAIVNTITRDDAQDMFLVMAALESLAGQLACDRALDSDIDEITALHDRMRKYYEARELENYFELNQQIHEKIVESARNSVLSENYARLATRIRRVRYIANLSLERWHNAMSEHEQILAALTKRDSEATKNLLEMHLKNKLAVIDDWLSQTSDSYVISARR